LRRHSPETPTKPDGITLSGVTLKNRTDAKESQFAKQSLPGVCATDQLTCASAASLRWTAINADLGVPGNDV
jgi:hypothetical protein